MKAVPIWQYRLDLLYRLEVVDDDETFATLEALNLEASPERVIAGLPGQART
jgi:hypothetical protein